MQTDFFFRKNKKFKKKNLERKMEVELSEAEKTLKTMALPTSNVTRIVKRALPEGISISKESKEGFCKAMGIFVLALASA